MRTLLLSHCSKGLCNKSAKFSPLLLTSSTNSIQNCIRKASSTSIPSTMSCWALPGNLKGIEGLQKCDVPTPSITNPGHVLVKVEAASLNPLDIMMLNGYGEKVLSVQRCVSNYNRTKEFNESSGITVFGRDFAGTVCSKGCSVSSINIGQKVMGVVEPFYSMGSHAQYVIVPQSNIVPIDGDIIEMSGIPYAALTSYSSLVLTAGSGSVDSISRKRILVAGAAGGVGLMCVQMLSAWGAQVAGVCSEKNFELLASLGVTELYDYNDQDSINELFRLQSFDVVLDGSTQRNLPYLEALRLNAGAKYITLLSPLLLNTDQFGVMPGMAKSLFDLASANASSMSKGRTVKWGYFLPSQKGLKIVKDLIDNKQIKPVTDKVFPFDEAISAYQHMIDGSHTGKTIISF